MTEPVQPTNEQTQTPPSKAVALTLTFFEAVGTGIDHGAKVGAFVGKVLSKSAAYVTIPALGAFAGVKLSQHFADAAQSYLPWASGFAGYIAGQVANNIPLWHSEVSSTRTVYSFNGTIFPAEIIENAMVPLNQVPSIQKNVTVDQRTVYFVVEEAVDRALRPFISIPCAFIGGVTGAAAAGAVTLAEFAYGGLRSLFKKKAAGSTIDPAAEDAQQTVPLPPEERVIGPYRVTTLSDEAARRIFDQMSFDTDPKRTLH